MKIHKKRNSIAAGAIQLVFACLIALPWPLAGQNIHAQAQTDMMTEDGLLAVDTQDATPNAGGPDIDVWYADGSDQLTFGVAGNPQPQVNILGNVNDPDGVKSLTYSLNGSSAEEVNFGVFSAAAALNETEDDSEQGGMGGDYGAVLQGLTAESDNARLDSPGDFNIEILTTQLNSNNTLELKAKDDNDNTTTKIIALRYVSGVTPTLPFTIDWEKVSSITDQTQIVDGRWTWSQGLGTVRSEVGYDRLVALGDLSWGEYEIEVPVTIHELPKSNSGGIGLVARWNGHFSANGEEPGKGWWNLGAYAYYRKRDSSNGGPHLLIRTGRTETAASTIKDYDVDYIQEGKTYIFKLRVEDEVNVANATPDASAGYFRFKVWEQDQIEPEDWQLELADGGEYQPRNGSVLLAAYNADVSFGKVVVRPLHVAVDYTVTANSNGEGKITLENSAQAPEFISGTYPSGTVLTLFPMPESDWEFANWSGDVSAGKENDNPLYFTIDADKTISANFESAICRLTVNTNPENSGVVTRNPSQDVFLCGAQVVLSAATANGWEFVGWSGDVQGEQKEQNPVRVTMDSTKSITATFIAVHELTTNIGSGDGSGVVSKNPDKDEYLDGEEVILSATPAANWEFVGWSGDVQGEQKEQNPVRVTMDSNKSIIATFIAVHELTTNIGSGDGSGVVSKNPDKDEYLDGEEVILSAATANGWEFVGWSGDVQGEQKEQNPVSVTMDSNKSITATFIAVHELTTNIGSGDGSGVVSKNPDKDEYLDGEEVILSATPAANWEFVGWSGDVQGEQAMMSINMNGDKTITATFRQSGTTIYIPLVTRTN